MNYLIDHLSDHQFEVNKVGGKSKQLHDLLGSNYLIPSWKTVSTDFVKAALKEHTKELEKGIKNEDENLTEKVYDLLKNASERVVLKKEISDYLQNAGETYFSVRSSVPEEDGKQYSFAGMMDSFLYTKGVEEIEDYVLKSLASAFSDHALLSRRTAKLSSLPFGAVMIQEMVTGEVSGVLFTANPKTGKYNEVIVNANYGLCEGIVSGTCVTDEFIWSTDKIEQIISDKQDHIVFDVQTGKEILKPVEDNKKGKACLTESQVKKLALVGKKIAHLKAVPQDIEWTIKEDKIYILQSRPITRMGMDLKENPIVWDNSNIQESYCGVTTPLTYSFIQFAYADVYRQTVKSTKLSDKVLAEYEDTFQNLLGTVKGRVYYNINNWYKMLTLFPKFSQNKADMEKMMGLQDPVDFIEDKEKTFGEKTTTFFRMLRIVSTLAFRILKIDKLVKEFNHNFVTRSAVYSSHKLSEQSYTELKETVLEIDKRLLGNWVIPIVNDIYVMIYNGKVFRSLENQGVENPEEVKSLLIFSQNDEIESILPTKRTLEIAKKIKLNSELDQVFRCKSSLFVWKYLENKEPDLFSEIQVFIRLYGDRCMGELKLETVTYKQEPEQYIDLLQSYVCNEDLLKKSMEEVDLLADSNYKKLLTGKLKKQLNHLRKAIKNRENLRFQRTRIFGIYRNVFMEMGLRLELANVLEEQRDVFFLKREELLTLTEFTNYENDWKAIVAQRKKQQEAYEDESLSHHFETVGLGQIVAKAIETDDSGHWKGIGCFPGIVRAEVKVVKHHKDIKDLQGKIMVAERTDPGWTPLFPTCAAVIVERGSALSHSAIITRELGIPAVVNVPQITKLVKDGDVVEINGLTGTVTLVE